MSATGDTDAPVNMLICVQCISWHSAPRPDSIVDSEQYQLGLSQISNYHSSIQ